MKNLYLKISILLAVVTILTFCKKEAEIVPAKIDTESVDEITGTSARVGGRVSNDGGSEITERGIYWGTGTEPEKNGTKLQSGSGLGIYHETISGLTPGVKYYVKAYARNSNGTAYGEETFFTTQISMPAVSTAEVTEFTTTTATIGGEVTADGGFDITERGIFWGVEPNPRLTGVKIIIGQGMGTFTKTLEGLSRAYTYYVVAYATNIKGSSYGEEVSFKTEPEQAVVYTSAVSGIGTHSANVGGNVSTDGGSEVTERGIWWGTSSNPATSGTKVQAGTGVGTFTTALALNPATTYYVTAYATNNLGTSFGDVKSFTTKGDQPKIDGARISLLQRDRVSIDVKIDSSDLNTTTWIEYGQTDQYGTITEQIVIPVQNHKDNDTIVVFSISGLVELTDYHFRVHASNELGEVTNTDASFRTVLTGASGTLTIDGITYNTVGIGYQEWMTSNLRSINDVSGKPIPSLVDTLWTKGYASRCYFDKDSAANDISYGALYNWYVVDSLDLCPAGWTVPKKNDITQLINYLGGSDVAGGKLMAGGNFWNASSITRNDVYNFNARGAGKRYMDGTFDLLKVEGSWWIMEPYSTQNAWSMSIQYDMPNIFVLYSNKKTGMSVRCMRNR
ncbi:MAG TPA: FISUMP domain-containing protein [Bacteroidales bacterium]|nr:FISUMP domain-containing protein [Bacteroidales bacterium]